MSSLWAIVPAAGSGKRMAAEVPKQYLRVAGATILEHTLESLLACPDIRGVVVVLDPSDRRADTIASLADPRVTRASGGAERVDSVLGGLSRLLEFAAEDDWALVHDAARPCLPVADLKRLIDQVLATSVGGLLAQPSADTIKQVDANHEVVATLDRATIWRAQTPQMFPLATLKRALELAVADGCLVTDEAMAMELAGHPVQVVEGPVCNLKVTVPGDLAVAEAWLQSGAGGSR